MKNEILFYYNLNPIKIHQQQNKTVIYTIEKKYILYKIYQDKNTITEIYKLYNYLIAYGLYCHKIMLNAYNEIITIINSNKYVLLEINKETKKIDINDIMYYTKFKINKNEFKNLERETWKKLWEQKVDYIEYELSEQKNKYINITHDYDFFLGITENCISLLDTANITNTFLTISHNRLSTKMTTDDFYNPFEFIIDIRVRDYGEHIKSILNINQQNNILERIIKYASLNDDEIKLLFIRILFPGQFFDICENASKKNIKQNIENEIKKIIENYNSYIKKIYFYTKSTLNFPTIEWLLSDSI